jgi:hypothetical protein
VIAKATPARAQHLALVLLLATIEQVTGVHTWRHPDAAKRAYFTALATWGSPLSDVEALLTGESTDDTEANEGVECVVCGNAVPDGEVRWGEGRAMCEVCVGGDAREDDPDA